MERKRMFLQTQEAIREAIERVRSRLNANTDVLLTLYKDGDMMDDPQLLSSLRERERLEFERNMLMQYLTSSEIIREPELINQEKVTVGHAVLIDIEYPEGEKRQLTVTIGTALDKIYLEEKASIFDESHMLISDESPLARGLLGRQKGEIVEYKTRVGVGRVEIIDITVSPLARSNK